MCYQAWLAVYSIFNILNLLCLQEVRVVDNAACLTPTENNLPSIEVNVLIPFNEYQVFE